MQLAPLSGESSWTVRRGSLGRARWQADSASDPFTGGINFDWTKQRVGSAEDVKFPVQLFIGGSFSVLTLPFTVAVPKKPEPP